MPWIIPGLRSPARREARSSFRIRPDDCQHSCSVITVPVIQSRREDEDALRAPTLPNGNSCEGESISTRWRKSVGKSRLRASRLDKVLRVLQQWEADQAISPKTSGQLSVALFIGGGGASHGAQ